MNKKSGFTAIEICVLSIFLLVVGVIFWIQKIEISEKARDEKRKLSINAMYFALEEVFYKENGYYPKTINENILTTIEPSLFTDPFGINIGEEGAGYRYEPSNCEDDKCKKYTLRAELEKEEDFIKKSRN